jgi:mannose-6-phosphate isomerase-like protein (cupin superfamily)
MLYLQAEHAELLNYQSISTACYAIEWPISEVSVFLEPFQVFTLGMADALSISHKYMYSCENVVSMPEPEDKNTEELTPEELAHTHLPEQMMYKIQTADAEDADTDDVRHPPQTIRTNEFRCLYFELKPDEKIDWHTHVPDLDEVNLCLEGRAKYTMEREDGSHQTLEIGPMEFVYVPGGARNKIEVVGDHPHKSLSVAKFDSVARLEALEDASGTEGAATEQTEWPDSLFVDRKRDEVVAKNDDLVSN